MAVTPPSGFYVYSQSPNSVSLAWTNPSYPDNYDGVRIERKIGAAGSWDVVLVDTYPDPLPSSWQDNSVEDGTQYYYRIHGYIDDPYEYSDWVETDTITPFYAPDGLWGTAYATSIVFHWNDNAINESGFKVYRRKEGGAYALVDTVGQNVTESESTSLDEGTWYYFKVMAYNSLIDGPLSAEFGIMTGDPPNAPSNAVGQGVSTSQINLSWNDNSDNETGFKINQEKFTVTTSNYYINFNEGASELTATLTESVYSSLDLCAEIKEQMEAAGALTYTVTYNRTTCKFTIAGSSTFSLLWGTGTNKANDISALCGFDESDDTGASTYTSDSAVDPFSLIDTLAANVTTYEVTSLSSARTEYFEIYAYNDSGNSNAATCSGGTFAAISTPTNVTVVPVSDTEADIYFDDNSSEEDLHEIDVYDQTDLHWESAIELAPNVTGYRLTGLTPANLYTAYVRAKQGSLYSDYSEGCGFGLIAAPSAPSGLALSEIADTSMRLTWTDNQGPSTNNDPDGETGFKIEKSTNGSDYTEIAVVGANITEYLAEDLDVSTLYYFKVRAYNAAGNSSYCTAASDTTLAAYSMTAAEKLLRKENPNFIFLLEVKPKMTVSGWTLSDGQTYTYEYTTSERGIDVCGVKENGVAYTEKISITQVESNASTFYFDFYARTLYVHTSDGTNPDSFLIEASFWLYFSNKEDVDFNDHNYLPLLRQENIPELSQEIKAYYEGQFGVSAGQIAIANAVVGSEPYFDKKYTRYTWDNAPVVLRIGGEGFDYADFETIFANAIKQVSIDDRLFYLDLMDFRENLELNVPLYRFSTATYPNLESGADNKVIPEYFGTWADIPATCVDTTNKIFKFNNGCSGSVTAVKRNDTTLVLNTDYYVDLRRSLIFLDEDTAWENQDKILVSFTGLVDSADDLITNGAEIFKYVLNNYYGLADTELDLDLIYKTKYDNTTTMAVALYQEQSAGEVIRNLEHSLRAYSCLGKNGGVGIKSALTTAPSNIQYVRNHQIWTPCRINDAARKYRAINVYYSISPVNTEGDAVIAGLDLAGWKYGTNKELNVNAYVTSSSDAETLAAAIQALINLDTIEFTSSSILFGVQPGDLIYFNRNRFYSNAGSANNLLLRIIKIGKSLASNRTTIVAEEVV